MIETKLFEIRDSGTFIPIFAIRNMINLDIIKEQEAEQYLLVRSGFGINSDAITNGKLECNDPRHSECTYDVFGHEYRMGRTFYEAHKYIKESWDKLKSGDVIDVEFILGETKTKKTSERFGG